MVYRLVFFLFFVLAISACRNKTDNKTRDESSKGRTEATTINAKGVDLEPRLLDTDSLEIIYFDDPEGDSLRYARFYSYVATKDTSIINAVVNTFKQPFKQVSVVRKCRSEGKIHLYKNGEPVKTAYFSMKNDSCRYMYFIKDGNFLYHSAPDRLTEMLKRNKSKAIKP